MSSSQQNTGRRSYTLSADPSNAFSCAAFSENSPENLLVTGSSNCSLSLWNLSLNEKDAVAVFTGHQSVVECVALSNDDTKVAAGGASGALKIWDVTKNQFLTTFTGHHANVSCLIFNPMDRQILASGSMDATAKLWDLRSSTKKHILNLKGHTKKTCCLDFSPDGKWLVTGSEDCTIMIWDLTAGGKMLMKISGHSGAVTSCRFHPNEYLLATGSSDKTVRFFDLETAECVGQSENDSQAIQQIMFHPSGACLFAASKSNLKILGWEPIRLYDVFPLVEDAAPDLQVGPLAYGQNFVFASYFTNRGSKFQIRKFNEQSLKPFAIDISALSLNHAYKIDQSFVDDAHSSSQSDSSPSLTNSGGRMRRSFYKKNSPNQEKTLMKAFSNAMDSLATTSDEESTSSSALTTTSTDIVTSSKAAATVLNLKKTPSREDLKFEVKADPVTTATTTPFQPKHTLKRSPTRNPTSKEEETPVLNRPSDFPVKIAEDKDKKRPYQRAKATVKPLRPQPPVADLSPDASSAYQTINNMGIQNQRPWNLKICAEEFLPHKFGQRNNMNKTVIHNSPKEFFDQALDIRNNVRDVIPVNNFMVLLSYCQHDDFVEVMRNTNAVIAAYTTAQARLKLYSYLEKLGRRVLYFDTDSIIYLSTTTNKQQYQVPIGWCLGEMTDELREYGTDSYITEFVSGGPKNYAFRVYSPQSGQYRHVIKVRGLTLSSEALKKVNFYSLRRLVHAFVKNDKNEKIDVYSLRIERQKDRKIVSRQTVKIFRIVYDKRVLKRNFYTLPYGFK